MGGLARTFIQTDVPSGKPGVAVVDLCGLDRRAWLAGVSSLPSSFDGSTQRGDGGSVLIHLAMGAWLGPERRCGEPDGEPAPSAATGPSDPETASGTRRNLERPAVGQRPCPRNLGRGVTRSARSPRSRDRRASDRARIGPMLPIGIESSSLTWL